MKLPILVLAVLLPLAAAPACVVAGEPAPPPAASAAEPAPHLVSGRYVIDVRSREEFEQGHLDGAIWIPHDQIGARIAAVLPDRTAPIGLYCGSGRRAGIALATLEQMGYSQAENLGGIEDARKKLSPKPKP